MVIIDREIWKLLKDVPTGSTAKIFLYIAINQPDDGIRGYRTTKTQLAFDMHYCRASIFRDLKWLKDNMLIQELKLDDEFDFMATPYYVMNNTDRQIRIEEWRRRCRIDVLREVRLSKKKLRKELREAQNGGNKN